MSATEQATDGKWSPRRYRVRHRTTYRYDDVVTASYARGHLVPRDEPGQRCLSVDFLVEPAATLVSEHVDHFGNRSSYVEIHARHTLLAVTATSEVDITRRPVDLASLDDLTVAHAMNRVGEELPHIADGPRHRAAGEAEADSVEAWTYLVPSPHVAPHPDIADYATSVLPPDRPLGDALAALVSAIHRDFAYRPGATSVRTTLPELLQVRAGVCQDFAHLGIGMLRSLGLPARYVSGYLETQPPPGRPKLQGADASHAWLSVLLPRLGWVDLDPTNDQPADCRYVVAGWGRDYGDVAPLRGVIYTEGKTTALDVAVDVERLDDDSAT